MRRSAVLELAGAMTPRDRIWSALRRFGVGKPFSIAEVAFMTGQHHDTIRTYLLALGKAGILTAQSPEKRPEHRPLQELAHFQLVSDTGVSAPRVNTAGAPVTDGRQQMWNVMRHQSGDFSFHDIAFCASIQEHQVAPQEAKNYMHFLARAGYLRLIAGRRANGRGRGADPSRYEFVRARNTGPRAPLVTRDKVVIDGNTGAVLYEPHKRSHVRHSQAQIAPAEKGGRYTAV